MPADEPWRRLFDLGVESYYSGDMAIGRWACECLLSLSDVPDHIRLQTRRNQLFYAPVLSTLVPSSSIRRMLFDTPRFWSRHNPSIAVDGHGYRAIVRSSNYTSDGPQATHQVFDPDGIVRTSNYLVTLNRDLALQEVRLIEDQTVLPRFPFPVAGFEDCRLFSWKGSWHAIATTREYHPNGTAQIGLLRLEDGAFSDLRLLDAGSGHHEKNWVPLVSGSDLLFIYTSYPTVVLRYTEMGMEEVSRHNGPLVAREFRGGSQAIAVDGGYLYVIHEVVVQDDTSRTYAHRFVFLDEHLKITRISTQFFFRSRTIEYCCGLAVRGDELAMTFGVVDREAFVAIAPLVAVLAILRPIYS